MGCQIQIAKTKPGRHSVMLHFVKTAKRFALPPPAALGVDPSGHCIENRIDIGTHAQPPNVQIIPDIDDYMNLFLRNNLNKTAQEFRCAGSAGEDGVMHGSILRGKGYFLDCPLMAKRMPFKYESSSVRSTFLRITIERSVAGS